MNGEIYQTSTIGAMIQGAYDGDVTVAELLQHGDFGLGTFNRLDGEMLVLDGVCHHLRADGSARVAGEQERTPFAVVTQFEAGASVPVAPGSDRETVMTTIDDAVPSANLVYAVRITGTFGEIRTRTVREQSTPYPPLAEATLGQAETVMHDVHGTLAGFRTPSFEQDISVAGYHLHFLADDGAHGGHALGFRLDEGTVEVGARSELHLRLPRTKQFLDANLTPADMAAQIRQAEGG
ncbi:acetolactate decarboxylase [Dactylosporangium sp. CS-047395]|uniref:acetolactate decarboxylase n=1 Tax=Dactylosporangium sp. CS-047395 TaxID=3239936 RepID=UPI003D8C9284